MIDEIPCLDWQDCYSDSWKGIITPDAYQHPAKFAYGLLSRLYDHGFACGWWKKGDVIGDPFGGVACGGIVAAYKGMRWIGVELEPKFVALANESIAKHRRQWESMGDVVPVIQQGDSRRFAELARVSAIITSPPYVSGGHHADQTGAWNKNGGGQQCSSHARNKEDANYGQTKGQIGQLKEGEIDAVLTSPGYGGSEISDNRKTINNMLQGKGRAGGRKSSRGDFSAMLGACSESGNVSAMKEETYWQAVATVYQQCFLALRPTGHLCCVVKDYVRNGNRVSLCDQTMRLLESIGFAPVERIRCWLVKEKREAGLFGEDVVTKTDRKSFFRRLAESKGSPRIDYEEVLVVRRSSSEDSQ